MQEERIEMKNENKWLKQKVIEANSSFYDAATQLLLGNVEGAKKFAQEANRIRNEVATAKMANPNLPIAWLGNLPVIEGWNHKSELKNEYA